MRPAPAPAAVRIRLRSLPPSAGLQWIRRAFRLYWRRPFGFIGLWMFFTLCLFIVTLASVIVSPLVMLAIPALLPLLTVGYMQAASDVLDDLKLRPAVFRAPFAGTSQAAAGMLVLMAIYLVAAVLLALCADAMDGGETRRWLLAVMTPPPAGQPPVMPAPSAASEASLRFVTLGLTLVSIPLWYAPALVHWGRQGVAQALFSSVIALWRTKGAFLLFLVGWFGVIAVFDAVFQLLAAAFGVDVILPAALTGQLVLSIVYFLSMWFGFVDTFEITSNATFRTVMAGQDSAAP